MCIGRSQSLAFTRGGFLCVGLYNLHCLCSQRGGALIPLTYVHLKGVMREVNLEGKVLFYSLAMDIVSIVLYGITSIISISHLILASQRLRANFMVQ